MSLLDERLGSVGEDLDGLGLVVMFFGAGVLHRYLDVAEVIEETMRPTEDVDALVCVADQEDLGTLGRRIEVQLQQNGWKHDLRSHRRNAHAFISPRGIPVDIVIDALYPEDDWPVVAVESAEQQALPNGRTITIPSPALFLICKLDASKNPERWAGPYESHDLEDAAQLIAGCSRLRDSIESAAQPARHWLKEWAADVLAHTMFGTQSYACLEGNWPRGVDVSGLDEFLDRLHEL
jgi:hypothetical protein